MNKLGRVPWKWILLVAALVLLALLWLNFRHKWPSGVTDGDEPQGDNSGNQPQRTDEPQGGNSGDQPQRNK